METLIIILALISFLIIGSWIALKITYLRTLYKNNFFKIKRAAKRGIYDSIAETAEAGMKSAIEALEDRKESSYDEDYEYYDR